MGIWIWLIDDGWLIIIYVIIVGSCATQYIRDLLYLNFVFVIFIVPYGDKQPLYLRYFQWVWQSSSWFDGDIYIYIIWGYNQETMKLDFKVQES